MDNFHARKCNSNGNRFAPTAPSQPHQRDSVKLPPSQTALHLYKVTAFTVRRRTDTIYMPSHYLRQAQNLRVATVLKFDSPLP